MSRAVSKIVIIAVALLAAAAPRTTQAADDAPEIVDMHVGFGGEYKAAHWTPVEITFRAGSANLLGLVSAIVADGEGSQSVVTAPRPVQLIPGRTVKVLLYVKFGSRYADLRIVLSADGKTVVERRFDSNPGSGKIVLPPAIDSGERLIVTLGASIGADDAARQHQVAGGEQVNVATLRDANELPTEWYGYDGVDWLIISTSRPEIFASISETSARRTALAEWIALGGKLVLVAGSQAPTVFAADSPFAGFAPGRLGEATTLRRTSELEAFVGGSKKVPRAGDELKLAVPKLEDVAGRIEIADGNLPLVVRAARGFGQIIFIGVDLDRAPFINWEGRSSLIGRLLGLSEPGSTDAASQSNPNAAYHYYGNWDLAGAMRRGLDDFKGITPISFAVVAALILGYIVLIGPGDYFLVRKVFKRMELTWITFPVWVVLVSGGAYLLAVYTKGHDLRLNQIDLIDVDAEQGLARGTSWLNLFTPQSQAFNLSIDPHEPSGAPATGASRLFAWLGSGETNYQGGGRGLFSGTYQFSPRLDAVDGVPIQVWSTKSFLARTAYIQKELPTADITLGTNGVPEGRVRNTLPIALRNCMLYTGRWAYIVGDLEPGASAQLRPDDLRDLEQVLRHSDNINAPTNRPRAVIATDSEVRTTLEKMMFFEAAGGRAAEGGAGNGSQSFVDLSDILKLDRAILVADADHPAAQLTRDGQPLAGTDDQHWTVYRFVFPVKK